MGHHQALRARRQPLVIAPLRFNASQSQFSTHRYDLSQQVGDEDLSPSLLRLVDRVSQKQSYSLVAVVVRLLRSRAS